MKTAADFKFPNGSKVCDQITGFEGMVTGRSDFITGCNQYFVQPKGQKTEKKKGEWFDEHRLKQVGKAVKELEIPTKAGGPNRDPMPRA